MTTREDRLVAAGPSVGPGRWLGALDELMTRIGSRFRRTGCSTGSVGKGGRGQPYMNAYRLALQFLLEKIDMLDRQNRIVVADEAKEQQLRAIKMVADMQ